MFSLPKSDDVVNVGLGHDPLLPPEVGGFLVGVGVGTGREWAQRPGRHPPDPRLRPGQGSTPAAH